ncbi:hypothetical protein VIGAN_02272400, partial [Vigna angularis var. angularis]
LICIYIERDYYLLLILLSSKKYLATIEEEEQFQKQQPPNCSLKHWDVHCFQVLSPICETNRCSKNMSYNTLSLQMWMTSQT